MCRACYYSDRRKQKGRRFLLSYPRRELNLKFSECYSIFYFILSFGFRCVHLTSWRYEITIFARLKNQIFGYDSWNEWGSFVSAFFRLNFLAERNNDYLLFIFLSNQRYMIICKGKKSFWVYFSISFHYYCGITLIQIQKSNLHKYSTQMKFFFEIIQTECASNRILNFDMGLTKLKVNMKFRILILYKSQTS